MRGYEKKFLLDSIALLRGERSSHMGIHQFADHKATRYGKPMSGTILWQEIERNHATYYIPGIEREMIAAIVGEIGAHVAEGTPFVDLGPGTLKTVAEKSLPFVRAVQSNIYVPIDTSVKFCSEAGMVIQKHVPHAKIMPSLEDFFSDDAEAACDAPALAFLGGITIANFEAPLSKRPPRTQLIRHLKNLAKITNGGWLLASTDANQDEAENRAMYFENALIELNHLYRMAEELPFMGFDPYAFEYDPYWISESSQLAHTALATKDMSVTVQSPYWSGAINIKANTRLHLKNSFKYPDTFFVSCAEEAGFTVLEKWSHHEKPMRIFLMRSMSVNKAETVMYTRPKRMIGQRTAA
jgi:uncharacterized SAM-dependent methyltransferase